MLTISLFCQQEVIVKRGEQMGAFEESFGKASDAIGYTIYRCTDFNAGKFFDVPATNKYLGDWSEAFTSYENYANEHFLAMDEVATTDTWMGVDADAAKTLLSDTETTLLEDILKLHDDIDSLHATILDNFKLTVDSAADAYISYDDLMKIENDFKEKSEAYDVQVKTVEDLILDLQEKYSKYGDIRTQDFSVGRTAFTNLCGDDETVGYLEECRQKLLQFDAETQILIEEANIDSRVDDLNQRMASFIIKKHPEYHLESYVDEIDKLESKYKEAQAKDILIECTPLRAVKVISKFKKDITKACNQYKQNGNSNIYINKSENQIGPLIRSSEEEIDSILKKDAQYWTKEEAYLVAGNYELAVHEKDTKILEHIYNSLIVDEPCKHKKFTVFGFDVYAYNAHLDPDKTSIILAYLEAINGTTDTETYQALFELGACNIHSTETKKCDFSTQIKIKSKSEGLIFNWEATTGEEAEVKYQTMLFGSDGMSLKQKYKAISDIKGINIYRSNLKATIVGQELDEYQSVEQKSDFKELSQYKEEKRKMKWSIIDTPDNYEESDVYRYINDEDARIDYVGEGNGGAKDFVADHYELMTEKQKSVYNYLYQKDKDSGSNKAEKYRKLLTPYLREGYADDTVNSSSNFGKSLWGIGVGMDHIATNFQYFLGTDDANIDEFGEQIPTAVSMMDSKLDKSLEGGWHKLYNFNKLAGASLPSVTVGTLTGGGGLVGEIIGVVGMAGIYGGSAYGAGIGYAQQQGYSNGEAKEFATQAGIKECCKTMLAYGILKGTSVLSSSGYASYSEAAAVSGVGTAGLEYIDETYSTPKIYKDTLGQDIEVDYEEAAKNATIIGMIGSAATYVAARQQGKVEPIEREGIYEKAHVMNGSEESNSLLDKTPYEISKMNREQLLNSLPDGWEYQEHNGRVHIKDENSNYRIRIDIPDKKTNYMHIHIFDENKNPLDVNGNIVSRKNPAGHIPYPY